MGDVLIVGAGPTGLALALWLAKLGVRVRIIDQNATAGTASRAVVIHARTLELYRQLGLADQVVAAGHISTSMHFWADGRPRAELAFGDAGRDITPYPFVLVYPQDHHEQLLASHLARHGIQVERQTALLGCAETPDGILAQIRKADGTVETHATRFLAGCDGAHSTVRHQLGLEFAGGTYGHVFYVADVEARVPQPAGDAHFALDEGDFVAVFPYNDHGHVRLIGAVRDERAQRAGTLRYEDIRADALRSLGVEVSRVNWFSTYRVHHRMAARFRQGRCFLLGDAAHVHSPAGGQGMNTGIADAANLAWKLAAVLHRQAAERLLDSYDAERRAFARQLVGTTDRAFTFVTQTGGLADFVKDHVAPHVLRTVFGNAQLRERAFSTVSQTAFDYNESPLSEGRAGGIRGGDRLPWVHEAGTDNFAPLAAGTWLAYTCADLPADVRDWCGAQGIPVYRAAWSDGHRQAGFARASLYLVRPDMYVGLALEQPDAAALARYVHTVGYPGRLDA